MVIDSGVDKTRAIHARPEIRGGYKHVVKFAVNILFSIKVTFAGGVQ